MTKPETKYTKSGRISIAYQIFGSGRVDLVYVPGWVSNIDLMWRNKELSSFLTELSQHVRIILFDKRGTGLSDRVSDLSTIEERMDDIRAVMDAVNSERAILFGHSEGGSVSALFAATYPQRTISLITFGVFARRRHTADYPWAPTDEERQLVYDMIESSWGSHDMDLASLAPSMSNDVEFMEWLASYFRSGASPSAALALTKMNTQVDIVEILETIEVPTLLLYRTDDIDVKIEEGRFIADRINDATFIEFPGNDHLFWVGDARSVLNEMIKFISTKRDTQVLDRVLATILKLKIVSIDHLKALYDHAEIEEIKEKIHLIVNNKVRQFRGQIGEYENDFSTVTFDGPSKAVHCAIDIRDDIQALGLSIAQSIHIGECVVESQNKIGGRAIKIADDLLKNTEPGEIHITNTVHNLLSGAGLEFMHKDHIQTFDQRMIQTLSLVDTHEDNVKEELVPFDNKTMTPLHNHSFLENVLQSIENHLDDEQYSIQTLCREVGASERSLQRKLKSITNKSPNQLVRSVRLHRAKEMILQQSMAIPETAFGTGFSSVSYFAKCFKKEFGHTPFQIKKKMN